MVNLHGDLHTLKMSEICIYFAPVKILFHNIDRLYKTEFLMKNLCEEMNFLKYQRIIPHYLPFVHIF